MTLRKEEVRDKWVNKGKKATSALKQEAHILEMTIMHHAIQQIYLQKLYPPIYLSIYWT